MSLRRKATGRGAKTAVTEKNVEKVEKVLDESPRRSVRNIAKRTKLPRTTVWRILRKKILNSCIFQQDGATSLFSGEFGLAEGAFWGQADLEKSGLQLASLQP